MCWHRWQNWQPVYEGGLTYDDNGTRRLMGHMLIQKRICSKCGKAELNEQRQTV